MRSNQFFARPRLTEQEHRRIGRRNLLDLRQDFADCPTLTDDPGNKSLLLEAQHPTHRIISAFR
jgi:hypothetical protein